MFCKSQVLMQFGSKVDSGRPTPELCVTKPRSRRIIKFSRDCILHQEYRVLWCVQVYLVLYWLVVVIFLMHYIWLSIVFCQSLQHQLVEDYKTISGLNPAQPPFYKQKSLLDYRLPPRGGRPLCFNSGSFGQCPNNSITLKNWDKMLRWSQL